MEAQLSIVSECAYVLHRSGKSDCPTDFALQPALNILINAVLTLWKTGEQEECHVFDIQIFQLFEPRRSRTAICSMISKPSVTCSLTA